MKLEILDKYSKTIDGVVFKYDSIITAFSYLEDLSKDENYKNIVEDFISISIVNITLEHAKLIKELNTKINTGNKLYKLSDFINFYLAEENKEKLITDKDLFLEISNLNLMITNLTEKINERFDNFDSIVELVEKGLREDKETLFFDFEG